MLLLDVVMLSTKFDSNLEPLEALVDSIYKQKLLFLVFLYNHNNFPIPYVPLIFSRCRFCILTVWATH